MEFLQQEEFPHPLSCVKQSTGYRFSYQIGDSLNWLGIRDMINDVWKKMLNLRPITYFSGSQGSETDIPHGYIWSPHLVTKPKGQGGLNDCKFIPQAPPGGPLVMLMDERNMKPLDSNLAALSARCMQ
ncbi:unnamed protein product [Lactuca saligna]|uniref:Uncharacterized protein n=1 Tax=Lactuca saligna TaxID=75948 RepID=A0AA35V722_LACSI|nr:unnamed protein product [Lactuca saligna]